MVVLTEGRHAGEFIVSEANGMRSREQVTVLADEVLEAGHVLGKVTKGAAAPVADPGNTGNGTIGPVTLGAGAKVGVYALTCIEPAANGGVFQVEDPQGVVIGTATVDVAFSGEVGFTIADGAADFAAGDRFEITVAEGSGKYKEYNPANTDGSEVAAAVLHGNVDATGADKPGLVIYRDAEVNASELVWFTGADAAAKAVGLADLAKVGIIGR